MMLTSGKGQLFSPLLKLSLRRQQKISATRSWSSCAHVSGGELYTANYQRRSSDNFDNPFQNLLPPCYIPPRLHPSHKEQLRLQQFRSFYSTKQREILPLVGAVTVFVVARYSWKAIQRMDEEWEEYEWQLQQYEKMLARNNANSGTDANLKTVAIDLGSLFTKTSIIGQQSAKPEVMISREGDRCFFNGVVYEQQNDDDVDVSARLLARRTRAALDCFYYVPTAADQDDGAWNMNDDVVVPSHALQEQDQAGSGTSDESLINLISDVLGPSLIEALERTHYDKNEKGHRLRMVVTTPTNYMRSNLFSSAFSKILSDHRHNEHASIVFLPEPVAAVWGAQLQSLLPEDDGVNVDNDNDTSNDDQPRRAATNAKTYMVADVGALTTQLSILHKDRVMASLTFPFGGETLIQQTIRLMLSESKSSPSSSETSVDYLSTDARALTALATQGRVAVAELGAKSRVDIHVPYLFADPSNHHLDFKLSRSVLEQAVQKHIQEELGGQIQKLGDILSPHIPPPVDLASLWISVVTQLLERSSKTPADIDHILLVGGGARSDMVTKSFSEALFTLMSNQVSSKLVVPDSSVRTELTIVGACSMLPSYDYDMDSGLQRIEQ